MRNAFLGAMVFSQFQLADFFICRMVDYVFTFGGISKNAYQQVFSLVFRNQRLVFIPLFLAIQFICFELSAQTFEPFTINQEYLLLAPEREYGSGISFYDVNNDGYDDISIPRLNDSLVILLSTGNDFVVHFLDKAQGEAKMMLWGDLENDGDPDLLVTYHNSWIKLFRNEGNLNLVDVTQEYGLGSLPIRKTYGASFGDINKDGFIDIVVNNYDFGAPGSWLLLSEEGLGFVEVSEQYGLNISSDGSFQSTIIDIDGDGWQDVHVANDRYPRDALLLNYQDFFINSYSQVGFDVYCNSMSSSFADFDNDLDMDLFVANTVLGNFLWERQEDMQYVNVAEEQNVEMFRDSWGGQWIDYNNDGWEDLFVNNYPLAGDSQPFFFNDSGILVRTNEISNDDYGWKSFAAAKGDFNGDGFSDMAINLFDGDYHKILRNSGAENHYVKVKLEGVVSNRDGIGTWLNYEFNGQEALRYSRNGDGYCTQDSQWLILGIGSATQIDTLKLNWLSGQVDIHTNIQAGEVLVLREGFENLHIHNSLEIFGADTIQICQGESVVLSVNTSSNVVWNNAEIGSEVVASSSGWYFATATNSIGIINVSDSVFVEVNELPQMEFAFQNVSCFGLNDGAIIPQVQNIEECLLFSDSGEQIAFTGLQAGSYQLIAFSEQGCTSSFNIDIAEPQPIVYEIEVFQPQCPNEFGILEILSFEGGVGNLNFTLTMDDGAAIDEANWESLEYGSYQVIVSDELGCNSSSSFDITGPSDLQILIFESGDVANEFFIVVEGGTPPYNLLINGIAIAWDEAIVLEAGTFEIICTDSNGCAKSEVLVVDEVEIISVNEVSFERPFYLKDGVVIFNDMDVFDVAVYNYLGQTIESLSGNSKSRQLVLSAGVYIVKWNQGAEVKSQKVVVE
jgi:hypothetical protein